MAQPSVAAFFSNRKRAAVDDVTTIKSRRLLDSVEDTTAPDKQESIKNANIGMRTRSGRAVKLIAVQPAEVKRKDVKSEPQSKQKKLVEFIRKGPLSPRKERASAKTITNPQTINEQTPRLENTDNVLRGLRTPTKQIVEDNTPTLKRGELKRLVKKELTFDEVKSKVSRSAKLQELKASLARIQQLEQTRKAQEDRNRRLREAGPSTSKASSTPTVQLKEFDTIELEVLASPSKTFKTPTKLPPPTPDKNELMSPRHTDASKRLLFSPAKQGSPVKLIVPPAYQRFMSLAETSKAGQLSLPFKYRHLIDIFKGLDSVVAMFHNRRECITFKKLKSAVQRMTRKNFNESHLAQIKHIYPDAFVFSQMKMRNFGSVSKTDYFQLVISPNVEAMPEQHRMDKINEDDVLTSAQSTSMNPHVMTARMQKFQHLLLERVKDTHDKFIRSLEPPLNIEKNKVTRWHPEFDLENCPEIERAPLPQPPNLEKYSSARDILSTARNLFSCATPMERAMERYEAKLEADKAAESLPQVHDVKPMQTNKPIVTGEDQDQPNPKPAISSASTTVKSCVVGTNSSDTSDLLKGLPQSLIERIRAKQAAKALDAMTRRPSQDQEATKYSRLPELARHLRNVFITERKGVLTLEVVIKKIQNSFRASLTPQDIESHLRLLAKELPGWASFHEVRKTMYLKIAKDMDMNQIIEKLETIANDKSK